MPDFRVSAEVKRALRELRSAVSAMRIVTFRYTLGDGSVIERGVRPLCLRYIGGTWTLGGWSESELAFRVFRVYRVQDLAVTCNRFAREPGRDIAAFLAAAERHGASG